MAMRAWMFWSKFLEEPVRGVEVLIGIGMLARHCCFGDGTLKSGETPGRALRFGCRANFLGTECLSEFQNGRRKPSS
jgi:hypothetical protein